MSDIEPFELRPADPQPRPCKICHGTSHLLGAVDFNKSCEEVRGKVLPPSGIAVAYRRCDTCGLVYTEAFDDWPAVDFETHIYNAGYAEVDPDYEAARPDVNASLIANSFLDVAASLNVLDYGGGNGRFARSMGRAGFDAATYDAFHPDHRARPTRTFDLVTCFETLEHMPDPKAGAADIAALLKDDGLLVFSTMVQPPDFAKLGLQWWYIGPRNGHVTLHTRASLAALWAPLGLQGVSFNDNIHAAYRTLPDYAKHLMGRVRPWGPPPG